VQLRAVAGDGVDEAAGSEPDLVAVAFLLRQLVDGDSLRGAGPVAHRYRSEPVLHEQRVLGRGADQVVLAPGAGADHEFDISFRFQAACACDVVIPAASKKTAAPRAHHPVRISSSRD
jgi:hypothetical protein